MHKRTRPRVPNSSVHFRPQKARWRNICPGSKWPAMSPFVLTRKLRAVLIEIFPTFLRFRYRHRPNRWGPRRNCCLLGRPLPNGFYPLVVKRWKRLQIFGRNRQHELLRFHLRSWKNLVIKKSGKIYDFLIYHTLVKRQPSWIDRLLKNELDPLCCPIHTFMSFLDALGLVQES